MPIHSRRDRHRGGRLKPKPASELLAQFVQIEDAPEPEEEPEPIGAKKPRAKSVKFTPEPTPIKGEPPASAKPDSITPGPKFSKKLLRDINKSLGSVERVKRKDKKTGGKAGPVDKLRKETAKEMAHYGGRIDNVLVI